MTNSLHDSRFRAEPRPNDALQHWCSVPLDAPTEFPRLEPGDSHLWRASLQCQNHQLERYAASLSPDEQERANRFKFDHLQRRFIAGRGILRCLLANYLAIAPSQIKFIYAAHGKPLLNPDHHPTPLSFNLAHSHDRALIGVSRDTLLGVDIERIRPDIDPTGLSQRFFTKREHRAIASLPDNQRVSAFFCLWTCKEAYLKATGEGLAGLQTVEISILPDESASLSIVAKPRSTASSGLVAQWHIYRCWPGTGYVGAIALGHHVPHQSTGMSRICTQIQTFEYVNEHINR